MTDQIGSVLLVDDELNTLKVLSAILRGAGYGVTTARTAEEALDRIAKNPFDVVVTDFKLPGMNGGELLHEIQQIAPDIPVVMVTAYGSIGKAVEAMKRGAFSYIAKPVHPDELITVLREAVLKHRLVLENQLLKDELRDRDRFRTIIGNSGPMQEVFSLVETVARSNSNVLIQGESGTGKELIARAIHSASGRADRCFVPIDCTALSEQLLESELFGHEKGSFTGAIERKIGQIENANGGTVFLDEVGELTLPIQKKFLRFLQEREFLRVGGTTHIKVDVRIIAATNRKLEEEIRRGTFREDLFFRLNVVRITMPPLRDRREDIPLLAMHFLAKYSALNNKQILSFDSKAMDALVSYDWPGNVRELENAVERAVVLCPAATISPAYFPRSLRNLPGVGEEPSGGGFNLLETERKLLQRALEKTDWNQTKAAEVLGISRKQLRTKMKHHGFLPGE
jgi:DNA-binding NtrC family response regulator